MATLHNRPIPNFFPKQIEAFWIKVIKGDDPQQCWGWVGSIDNDGYGQYCGFLAHRIAYFLQSGEDPGAQNVLHACDNPPCVNGSHLFLGSQSDNMLDAVKKGRANRARGDASGARLHPERLIRGDAHWMRKYPERVARGENRINAKLTWADVELIRNLYKPQDRHRNSSVALGKRFGVSHAAILSIVKNKTWIKS